MPTVHLYRRIASFSYDDAEKAADMLAVSFATAEGNLYASYNVGKMKVTVLAGLIVLCVMWAICDAWLFLFVAIALSLKLSKLVNKVGKDRDIMLGYRELQAKGVTWDV
jgi:hypothetical protein